MNSHLKWKKSQISINKNRNIKLVFKGNVRNTRAEFFFKKSIWRRWPSLIFLSHFCTFSPSSLFPHSLIYKISTCLHCHCIHFSSSDFHHENILEPPHPPPLSSNYSSICTSNLIPFNFTLGVHPFMNEHLPLLACSWRAFLPPSNLKPHSQRFTNNHERSTRRPLTKFDSMKKTLHIAPLVWTYLLKESYKPPSSLLSFIQCTC
jgi:hypothetical protein